MYRLSEADKEIRSTRDGLNTMISLARTELAKRRAAVASAKEQQRRAIEDQQKADYEQFHSQVLRSLPVQVHSVIDWNPDAFQSVSLSETVKLVLPCGGEVWCLFTRQSPSLPWAMQKWTKEREVTSADDFDPDIEFDHYWYVVPYPKVMYADWCDNEWTVMMRTDRDNRVIYENDLAIALALAEEREPDIIKCREKAKHETREASKRNQAERIDPVGSLSPGEEKLLLAFREIISEQFNDEPLDTSPTLHYTL